MSVSSQRLMADVLGISVDAVNMETALDRLDLLLDSQEHCYVCVASAHGIVESQHDDLLAQTYRGAAMTVPDGMPLVWIGRKQGHRYMERVPGPDLMLEVFRRKRFSNRTHFFYGGKPGVAEELRERFQREYPHAKVVGTFTPPFRELLAEEEVELATMLAQLKPNFLWVGIGCPKQELFMRRYGGLLNAQMMIGVGAAFDYHTGRISDSPKWVKQSGLQWLHRLIQDPRRLWRRYGVIVPVFLIRVAWLALHRVKRKETQSSRSETNKQVQLRS